MLRDREPAKRPTAPVTLKRFVWLCAGVLAACAAAVTLALTLSLPRRAGGSDVAGLDAAVTIELDAAAIPKIHAETLEDAYRAQGFVHAQERFFQMDLGRRSAAGEIAALIGPAALPLDRERRVAQLRQRARELAASLPARHRAWLAAYAEGVNAGLADLGARPPEYWLLRTRPEPWRLEDSLLVVFAFYTMLSNNEAYERPQAIMEATLDADTYAFLTPSTTRFDRPLFTSADDPTGGYQPLPLPEQAVGAAAPGGPRQVVMLPPAGGASNQWAVGAARGSGDVAIVANDPHLGLRLPNVFHRAELYFAGRALRGLGIPGVPGIVIGATEELAWGLTVSNADQSDWVILEIDPDDPDAYRVPGGVEAFVVQHEAIEIRGRREPELLEVRRTRWGPVAGRDGLGRPLALQATWLEPGGLDLDLLELAFARTVEEGLDVVAGWAGPSLNWMFADADGRVGWAVNGPLPARRGFDGSAPRSRTAAHIGWDGYAAPPTYAGDPSDVLFTANNRTLPAVDAAGLSRVFMPPFRAKRIADLLAEEGRFDEAALAAIQLDTRVEAYDEIRRLALDALADDADEPIVAARAAIAAWDGRAEADSTGFRLVHAMHRALLERLLVPLLGPALEADPQFVYRWPLADESMRRLLDERPPHLLPPGQADWSAWLREVLIDALRNLDENGRAALDAPWGEVNRLAAAHPLAGLPLIGRLLRLPAVPQAGAPLAVRVIEPSRGAVVRMVVSPTRPEAGILQLAGGQSGHPLSRHFDDQWRAWHDGSPAPFLAGEPVSTIVLRPAQSNAARTMDGGS